jgi:hypothetical protein
MPHNDEVTLHAYLDGALGAPDSVDVRALEARLADDPELRARLEEIRSVRARVDEILGESGPLEIVKPAFAEIQARAARRKLAAGGAAGAAGSAAGPGGAVDEVEDASAARPTSRGRRLPRFRMPLAWAATVTMAVGAGWIARSVSGEFEGGAPEQVTEAFETEPAPSRPGEMADEPALLQEALAPASREVGAAQGVPATPESEVARAGGRGDAVVTADADDAFAEEVRAEAVMAEGAGEGKDDDRLAKMAAPADGSVTGRVSQAELAEAEAPAEAQERVDPEQKLVDQRVVGADQEADEARDEVARNRAAPPPVAAKSAVGGLANEAKGEGAEPADLAWREAPEGSRKLEANERVSGCYALDRGVVHDRLPQRFELTDHPAGDGDGEMLIVRDLGDASQSVAFAWTPFGADSVWISWSDGVSGVTLRVGPSAGGLAGKARAYEGDRPVDDPVSQDAVHATRIACED